MSKLQIAIADENGSIQRDMTADELEAFKAEKLEAKLQKELLQAEAEAKAQAKTALLERLGITEDEAKLLLS
jgi:hypothetical protein